jgi:hypothetical protein
VADTVSTTASLSINAKPWAIVFVDGKSVGTTPLANVHVTAGRHEIVWQNPLLGERRQTVDVQGETFTRLAMDFTR